MRADNVRGPSGGTRASCVQLRLLGRFAVVVDGTPLALARTGQRLLTRVALNDGAEDRGVLAGALWPDHTCSRAQANLRGVVWRLPAALHRCLVLGTGTLAFDDRWEVDVHAAERLAVTAGTDLRSRADSLPAASLFRYDLLPDWDEPVAARAPRALPATTSARNRGPRSAASGGGSAVPRHRLRAARDRLRTAPGECPVAIGTRPPRGRKPGRRLGQLRTVPTPARR